MRPKARHSAAVQAHPAPPSVRWPKPPVSVAQRQGAAPPKTKPPGIPPPALIWPGAPPGTAQAKVAGPTLQAPPKLSGPPAAPRHAPAPPPVQDPHGRVRPPIPGRHASTAQRAIPVPQVAVRPVLQRSTSKDNWSSSANREDARNIASMISKDAAEKGRTDIFAHGYAIHHKISKEHLAEIAKANAKARTAHKKKTSTDGAKRFWKAVTNATKKVVDPKATDDKRLWNIPANLEVGPSNVTNNPGMGFDPNTVPGKSGRRLTPRSEQLQKALKIFQDADGDLSDEEWDEMAKALEEANTAHESLIEEGLALPLEEQWSPSTHTGFRRQVLPE